MKKALFVGMAAGLLMLGVQSKAEAALAGSFHICQGATCINVAANNFGPTTVGDYTVEGLGSSFQSPGFAQTSTSTIQIFRTTPGTGVATALDVWYTVTGYTLPAGTGFNMSTTGSASKTGTSTDSVSYTAWYSSTNSTGFPTGVLGGTGTCTPGIDPNNLTTSCNGNTAPTFVGAGSALYSLISRTTFNIGINDASLFSSTGQAAITAVPEPGSMMLLGTGLLGLAATIRRRMKS